MLLRLLFCLLPFFSVLVCLSKSFEGVRKGFFDFGGEDGGILTFVFAIISLMALRVFLTFAVSFAITKEESLAIRVLEFGLVFAFWALSQAAFIGVVRALLFMGLNLGIAGVDRNLVIAV